MNYQTRRVLWSAAVATFSLLANHARAQNLTEEKQRVSYMVGMDVAKGLSQIKDELDMSIVIQAMTAAVGGEQLAMTDAEAIEVRKNFIAKRQQRNAVDSNSPNHATPVTESSDSAKCAELRKWVEEQSSKSDPASQHVAAQRATVAKLEGCEL